MTRFQAGSAGRRLSAVPILLGVSIVLVVAAISLAVTGSSGVNPSLTWFAAPLVLAVLPAAAIVTFRWPLIFPFGLWAALLPFDLLLAVGSAGSAVRYVELGTAGILFLRIIATRKMVAAPRSWYPWLILVGWMTLTALWSIRSTNTQAALFTVIPLFLMLTFVAVYPISLKEMRGVLIAIVVGSIGAAAFGFNLYEHGQLSDDSRLTLMTDAGLVVDANFFATSFLLPVAICTSVVLAHRSLWLKVLAAGAIFAMLASIFLSGSRGAFVSVAVVLLYFVIRTRNRIAMLAIACGTGLIFLAFPTMLRRLTEVKTASSGSGRTFIWSVGAKALSEHWLGGSGFGTFPIAYDKAISSVGQSAFEGWSRPAHNVLVGTSVELGIIGALLVVVAWWFSFRQAATISRSSPNFPLRIASEAAILGLFVNALFIDPFLIKYFWLAFMIPIMLHNVERSQPARKSRGVSAPFAALMMRRANMIARRPRQA